MTSVAKKKKVSGCAVGQFPLPSEGDIVQHEIREGLMLTIGARRDEVYLDVSITKTEEGSHTRIEGQNWTKPYSFFDNGKWLSFAAKGQTFEVRVERGMAELQHACVYIRYHGQMSDDLSEWSCRACGEWNEVTDDPFCVNCENIREED